MPEATKNVLPGIFACYKKNDSLFAHPHALPPKHQYEHLFFFLILSTYEYTQFNQPSPVTPPPPKDKKKEKQNKKPQKMSQRIPHELRKFLFTSIWKSSFGIQVFPLNCAKLYTLVSQFGN